MSIMRGGYRRKRMRKRIEKKDDPDLILCSDLHLRTTAPVSRIDDYWEAQSVKIEFLKKIQKKYSAPILCAGDVFDISRSIPFLEQWAIKNLPEIYAIPGQHDLPNHNLKLYNKSSFSVLEAAGNIKLLSDQSTILSGCRVFGIPYGEKIKVDQNEAKKGYSILVLHTMVYKKKPIHKSVGGKSALSLLKKYPEFDLIVTGDNHQFFTEEYQGRLLVNCGSMMRIKSDQIKYDPQFHLWFSEENKIESVLFPFQPDVMNLEYVEKEKENNLKLEEFINKLKKTKEIGLSFTDNVESILEAGNIKKGVRNEVWEAIEN